jgi:hypothetical protein
VICHECLMAGQPDATATAMCRFCFVGLCKAHLVEVYRDPPTVPQYSCRHTPARTPNQPSAARAIATRREASSPERDGTPVHASRLLAALGTV